MVRNTYFFITIMIISCTSHLAKTEFDHWCSYDMKPRGQCGAHLDELLEGTCGEGNYNTPEYSMYSVQGDKIHLSDFIMGKRKANIYLKKRKDYYYQGIVCECCINQCSIPELRTYCLASNWADTY